MNELPFSFKDIVEEAQDVVLVTKASPLEQPGPEIVYVNKAFTRLTGYTAQEAIGKNPRILQSGGTDKKTSDLIHDALLKQQPVKVTIKNYSKMGAEYWLDLNILPLKNAAGEVTHFAAIQRDVTEQKDLELKLDALSKTDELTGLLNRRAFDEIMIYEFSQFTRTSNAYSLLMIDIDHFQKINDTYGHASGDLVLKKLADSFEEIFRSYDRAARIGGEEFCILLHHTTLEHALISAIRFRQSVQKNSFAIGDENIQITVSIGVSEVTAGDFSFTDVIERAEKALLQARQNGSDQVQLYKP
ncbi:MAG: diguanylate cyclase [Gammaproteobacteria bacterium]|nr:diguanylate cyclase [Gammaproteobacteria bacterium]MBL6999296.1 diguanylate cyclase [Gammaproteobacteria bacterium]